MGRVESGMFAPRPNIFASRNVARVVLVWAAVAIAIGCDRAPTVPTSTPAPAAKPQYLFTDITAACGLGVADKPWPDGSYILPEIMGGGVALFDYDNDGDLDILRVSKPPPRRPDAPAPNRLFQQQADGTFNEVTEGSGLGDPGYGQSVGIGDVNNDGYPDVYVANYGPDALYLNNGDGTFSNVTAKAGISEQLWSTTAAFLDYDRDGDLDLFVVRYVQYPANRTCRGADGAPDYCGPQEFEGLVDHLYRNEGNGTFSDVTAEAGIDLTGKGLGIVCADLTGDGWVDIYVANDMEANHLWVNGGDGTFANEAFHRGCALNTYGRAESSMGVAIGDVDGDGLPDVLITDIAGETFTLYVSSDAGLFVDKSSASGLSAVDFPYTGMSCGFLDFDNDGDLDLAVVNGRVVRGAAPAGDAGEDFWSGYAERNLLFTGDGGGRFADARKEAGTFASLAEPTIGLAMGDIDGDGDVDMVTSDVGYRVRVYRNDAPRPGSHWLSVRALVGKRYGLGARIIVLAGARKHYGLVLRSAGYLSSNDARVHFGLGSAEKVEAIEVTWPDGSRERFGVPGVDREVTVRQGRGERL